MKLYDDVDRIYRDLEAKGIGDGDALTVADLAPHDHYHYFGTAAVDHAIRMCELRAGMRVLDVGSGLGGPARHIAHATGASVTAIELQDDVDRTARELTRRVGLTALVQHRRGDILEGVADDVAFDAVVSWLAFLHIPNRARLFSVLAGALKRTGRLYIEDFTQRREPTPAEWRDLREKVLCPYLPTREEYERQLGEAGFEAVQLTDMTADWTTFTAERLADFRAVRERHVSVHGARIVDGLEDFYATVAHLFHVGVVGGVRIVATRP
jgi:cyclopropane fatty-acyl-phospholipid synthase-like methyltransferase